MFLVLLTYERPLDELDRRMAAHVAFLEEGYRAGLFLVSGRQVPRRGGVILAVAPSRADLEALMAHDPFVREGLARCEIVEFRTSLHHPALARFADPGTRAVRDVEERVSSPLNEEGNS
jgi:uncharacterized protein YciI